MSEMSEMERIKAIYSKLQDIIPGFIAIATGILM